MTKNNWLILIAGIVLILLNSFNGVGPDVISVGRTRRDFNVVGVGCVSGVFPAVISGLVRDGFDYLFFKLFTTARVCAYDITRAQSITIFKHLDFDSGAYWIVLHII